MESQIKIWKPTAEQLAAAHRKRVPDLIAPQLKVLFCGINPGLYSAAVKHHFGRPGNRFWPTLHAAGFTDRVLSPFEERELLERGYGITNIVARATATADELTSDELVAGARRLRQKILQYKPATIAMLGITAFRIGFGQKKAKIGRQEETIGDTQVWILPNPSGLNAHYQLADLARLYAQIRGEADASSAEFLTL